MRVLNKLPQMISLQLKFENNCLDLCLMLRNTFWVALTF